MTNLLEKADLFHFAREVINMNYGFANIYWRDMIRFVRFRTMLFSSLLQPALWLAFFGIAMSSSFDSLMGGMPVPRVHMLSGILRSWLPGSLR